MFLGEYQHSLDAKGRIILPSRFRAQLAQGLVMTRGADRCLWIMAKADWDAWAERLRERLGLGDPRARDFARLIFSGAHEAEPDKQGRIPVPENLRVHADLERDVTVIGAGPRVEVWQRERWEARRSEAETHMEENLPDLPQ